MEDDDTVGVTLAKNTRLLSVNQVAERINMCRKSVENQIALKKLKVVRIGRRVLIREHDLEVFISKRRS
jgi:excisionase family DNA binding protein